MTFYPSTSGFGGGGGPADAVGDVDGVAVVDDVGQREAEEDQDGAEGAAQEEEEGPAAGGGRGRGRTNKVTKIHYPRAGTRYLDIKT